MEQKQFQISADNVPAVLSALATSYDGALKRINVLEAYVTETDKTNQQQSQDIRSLQTLNNNVTKELEALKSDHSSLQEELDNIKSSSNRAAFKIGILRRDGSFVLYDQCLQNTFHKEEVYGVEFQLQGKRIIVCVNEYKDVKWEELLSEESIKDDFLEAHTSEIEALFANEKSKRYLKDELSKKFFEGDNTAATLYMPSLQELSLIYYYRKQINVLLQRIEGADPIDLEANHWSSTEYTSNYAWFVYFSSGTVNLNNKYVAFTVRPCVAF